MCRMRSGDETRYIHTHERGGGGEYIPPWASVDVESYALEVARWASVNWKYDNKVHVVRKPSTYIIGVNEIVTSKNSSVLKIFVLYSPDSPFLLLGVLLRVLLRVWEREYLKPLLTAQFLIAYIPET